MRIRSDSISALSFLVGLRTSGQVIGAVARELALDLAEAVCVPCAVEHVPGVSNILSDHLSRQFAPPKMQKELPSAVRHAKRTFPECRDQDFWRAP